MQIKNILLVVGLYLSFVRATNINFFYPSDSHFLSTIDYTLQTAVNYVLILMVGAYFFIGNNYRFLRDSLMNPKILPIVLLCVVSTALSVDLVQSVKFISTVFAISMFAAIYAKACGQEKLIHAMSNFTIAMCFVNLVYVLAMPQYGIMSGEHAGSWRGMFIHKNISGPFFAVGFFFIVSQLQRHAYRKPQLAYAALLIALLFVGKSLSSTALVSFVFMAGMFVGLTFLLRIRQPLERVCLVLGLVSIGLIIALFAGDMLVNLFFEATGKDATFTGRTAIWKAVIHLSESSPIIGFGMGMAQYPDFIARIHGEISFEAASTHSSFLDLVLNLGYPGAILVTGIFFGQLFRMLVRNYEETGLRRNAVLGISVMMTMLIIGFTSGDVLIGRSAFWLFMFTALLLSEWKPAKSETGKLKLTTASEAV